MKTEWTERCWCETENSVRKYQKLVGGGGLGSCSYSCVKNSFWKRQYPFAFHALFLIHRCRKYAILSSISILNLIIPVESKSRRTPSASLSRRWASALLWSLIFLIFFMIFDLSIIFLYLISVQVVHGLLPNVKLDVFFPGFPTMKHLPHKGELKEAHVKVRGGM